MCEKGMRYPAGPFVRRASVAGVVRCLGVLGATLLPSAGRALMVEAPVVTPGVITAGEPTALKVTSRITRGAGDPQVAPGGVLLLRLGASHEGVVVLGTMRDDGTGGDDIAGDGLYTVLVNFTETRPGDLRLRVSVALLRTLRRVFSALTFVPIVAGGAAATASPSPSPSPLPPSATATATPVPTVTATGTATASDTATHTSTTTPTHTATLTRTTTATPTPTATGTHTPTSTATATSTPTQTAANTSTHTHTPAPTLTHTPTNIPPDTPTDTPAPTPTSTVDASLPPDPADVAPPVDQSVVTTMQAATEFLYTGTNPIQTGVASGVIDARSAAVLRGRVMDRTNAPLPGVQITILGHPEFGQTLTRADGMFDIAVNGGGVLTVNYEKAGLLPAQRHVYAGWNDYGFAPDVILIALDRQLTVVDLTANVPIQVAQGSVVSDADGTRQATVLVPQGTAAMMVLPGGGTQALSTLSIRATEYTVGANGPEAMPAELPPTSSYTYAVELSADEAMAAGATEVRFSSPLPFYVENFLGFPVGTTVPFGTYDRQRAVWVPENSGMVIQIVSVTGGVADVDIDGDGIADGAGALAALSITDAERQQLALLYQTGQSFWRVLVPHFSTEDLNWPTEIPSDGVQPDQDPELDDQLDESCTAAGSIIECQSQILGEVVDVPGTPFRLHYQSQRVPGHKVPYSVEIPLSGAQVPASLRRIDLDIRVAGRRFQQSFPPQPNQRTTFVWDGLDIYGRTLQGHQQITIRVGYTYLPVYASTVSFADFPTATLGGTFGREEITIWREWVDRIGSWDARAVGLGGWTLSPHHTFDLTAKPHLLYRGDGQRQSSEALGPFISTFAGRGFDVFSCVTGDGGPATQAGVCPDSLATAADGSVYIAMSVLRRVRRVGANGIITRAAGDGNACSPTTAACGDGGPATQAQINTPWALAVAPDDSFYIADVSGHRVRRVDKNGTITTIAGTGVAGFAGDGGPARLAQLNGPISIAVGPDGSVYIVDGNNLRIRRVGPDGTITTVMGTGQACITAACGDGGPAVLATLPPSSSIAVGRDGSLYIAGGGRVRQVGTDGIVATIAGTGMGCNGTDVCGDGGPAAQAPLNALTALAVSPDDTIYIVENNVRVRWMRPNGIINTLAGPFRGATGDGGLAQQARLDGVRGLAVGPDGSVYVSENAFNQHRVRRISPIVAGNWTGGFLVPAADGSEVYVFDPDGRHLRTVDALSAAVRHAFTYDATGQLATITDGDGNVTTIERDGAGNPSAIVGPFGQRTALNTNPDGYLDRITDPIGAATQVTYTTAGLLTDFTNPRGHVSHYDYDALGRLTGATDPTSATKTLARVGTNRDYTVTLTSALGRTTTYRVERLGTGNIRLTTTSAKGQVQAVIGLDGTHTATLADGTTLSSVLGPDPRWRMQAPIAQSVTITTPGGRVHTAASQRAVTLANPTDLLSLSTLTETGTINGRAFTRAYDATTRTVTETSPTGRRNTTVIDTSGRVAQTQFGGLAASSFSYDLQGRLASITQGSGPGSRTTTVAYGVAGFMESVTDSASHTVDVARDANGRITDLTLPDGAQSHVDYDANGNVTTLTPPGRPDHALAYTENNQASAYTAPTVGAQNTQTLATYDADRQLLEVDRPDGQSVALQYDSAGRLSSMDLTLGDSLYSYDSAGRLATVNQEGGANLTFAYDGGLPIGIAWSGPITGNVTRAYDNNFRLTSLTVNGANAITLAYDADSLPIQVGALTLTRNAQNGFITSTALGGVTDTTTYDVFGAPATYAVNQNGGTIYATTYTRDALGRIASKSETIGGMTHTFGYIYDVAGRLLEVRQDSVLTASYSYDGNGNRLSRTNGSGTLTATYDAQDRLDQFGTSTYAHNAAGELQSKTAGGQTTTYQYDALGNLTGVTLPTGTQIEYLLDGGHRRVGKKRNGTLVQGFLYQDGLKPIAELDGGNNVVSRFVYAGGINVPAYMIKAGVTYRIITDHLGSPRLVLDAATGSVAQELDYDEFGNVILDTNPGFQPCGFAGGLYDPDTQLTRYGLRDYDPETGRWTLKDPGGFVSGPNLYIYADSDPINLIDPLGDNPDHTREIDMSRIWRREWQRFAPRGDAGLGTPLINQVSGETESTKIFQRPRPPSWYESPACETALGVLAAAAYWVPRALDDEYSGDQFVADLAIGPGVPIVGAGVAAAVWVGFTKDPVGQVKEAAKDTGIGLGISAALGPLAGPVNLARWIFD